MLKKGIYYTPFGKDSLIDNSNITEDIFDFLLKKGIAKKEDLKIIITKKTK